MKNRILLKEIPPGKFHSAIFTTYSINLYYFEQQVLPLLGSKSIHYVSVLADSAMLSSQLNSYCLLSEQRKRNYSLNGIQSKGAFHPKIIFLAGETSLMLLIGSGNLTSSGHGKNLEVWNAIYIDSSSDEKLGFVIQAWQYLKSLHEGLGFSAKNKLNSIEEHCSLLHNIDTISLLDAYPINATSKISFLATFNNQSLYSKLSSLITEKIERITIMSPYYDVQGKFIHLLNSRFNPSSINVILQDNFGAIPNKMKASANINFYNWNDIKNKELKQNYFHAKNIIFEGKQMKYLVSGSSNASIAAFGNDSNILINQEACILYQSAEADFLNLLGINLAVKKINLVDIEQSEDIDSNVNLNVPQKVFIKAIEKNYDSLTIYFSSNLHFYNLSLRLFDPKGITQFQKDISFSEESDILQLTIPKESIIMYGEIYEENISVSNKQFVIDVKAFEGTNPSPNNRSLNQIRKLIESGTFSTQKIIEYLNTIHKQTGLKKKESVSNNKTDKEYSNSLIEEEENDLLYMSYEEIQNKSKNLSGKRKAKDYVEYKSIRLWESIFTYLKENKQREEQENIDEEETEDINKSSGRSEDKKRDAKKAISKSNFDRIKQKIEKFLESYTNILESKISDDNADKPSLIDLSMYLIVLEILLHLSSHKEKIEAVEKEETLLFIPFSTKYSSWSEYLLKSIGLFTLWVSQKGGINEIDNDEYRMKSMLFKKMAFKTTVSALSLFSLINKMYDQAKVKNWIKLGLLNANQLFNTDNIKWHDVREFEEFAPKDSRDEIGEFNLLEELSINLNFINDNSINQTELKKGDYYLHPEDGYTLIDKIITNPTNTYYKLIHIGYDWDDEVENYWTGKVFSVNEWKWLGSRK